MKKQQAKKSRKKTMQPNKAAVYTIVILAVIGLVGSSILAAFGQNLFNDNNTSADANYMDQMQLQIRQYEENLKTSPDNTNLLTQLGNAYYQLGVRYSSDVDSQQKSAEAFAKALEPYAKVLEKTPEDVNVRVDRAVAAYYSNNYEEAQKEFVRAIELDPKHAKAHFNYGIFLYYGLNKAEEATLQFEEVVALNPANEAELVTQAKLMIATIENDLKNIINNGGFLPEDTDSTD